MATSRSNACFFSLAQPPEVRETLSFQKTNVTVTLEWTQEFLTSYNITKVIPQATVVFVNDTSFQLTVPYNVPYNVSVTAYLCGQKTSTDIELLYSGKAILLIK